MEAVLQWRVRNIPEVRYMLTETCPVANYFIPGLYDPS